MLRKILYPLFGTPVDSCGSAKRVTPPVASPYVKLRQSLNRLPVLTSRKTLLSGAKGEPGQPLGSTFLRALTALIVADVMSLGLPQMASLVHDGDPPVNIIGTVDLIASRRLPVGTKRTGEPVGLISRGGHQRRNTVQVDRGHLEHHRRLIDHDDHAEHGVTERASGYHLEELADRGGTRDRNPLGTDRGERGAGQSRGCVGTT